MATLLSGARGAIKDGGEDDREDDREDVLPERARPGVRPAQARILSPGNSVPSFSVVPSSTASGSGGGTSSKTLPDSAWREKLRGLVSIGTAIPCSTARSFPFEGRPGNGNRVSENSYRKVPRQDVPRRSLRRRHRRLGAAEHRAPLRVSLFVGRQFKRGIDLQDAQETVLA
jgi:hypothetical protein